MFELKMSCPHCDRCLGYANGSDNSCSAKVLKSPPINKGAYYRTFQNKCYKCGKLVYIVMGFEEL